MGKTGFYEKSIEVTRPSKFNSYEIHQTTAFAYAALGTTSKLSATDKGKDYGHRTI